VVSFFVIIIGLLGMLVSLYTALAGRRHEMAVLRAVGAGPSRIILLLVLESGFLSMGGAIVGVLLVYVLSFLSQPLVEQHFGLFIPIQPLTVTAYLYILGVIVAGLLIGFVPALRAYRNSLADGLTMRL
jgi:putative ABC transport system permease protein